MPSTISYLAELERNIEMILITPIVLLLLFLEIDV
jgi:hypothetical protein